MTREEAIERFNGIINAMSISVAQSKVYPSKAELNELCAMAIEALSAYDEQGGTWRDGFGFAHCSICGKGVPRAIGKQTPFNFCPYCGARMRNEK